MSNVGVLVPNHRGWPIVVDETDADRVFRYYWQAQTSGTKVKIFRVEKRRKVFLWRFLLNAPKGLLVDHINGNRLDNRRCNLRIATPTDNARNSRKVRGSRNRFKGVGPVRDTSKWRASITCDKKIHHLGTFATEEAAAHAYDEAARSLFGDFATLNFPREGEQSALRPIALEYLQGAGAE